VSRPTTESRPRLAPGCRLSERSGESVALLLPESVMRLNGPGLRIVQSCDGVRTLGEIVQLLQAEYASALPDRVLEDTMQFLELLHARRAIDF
jgi:pyrroloquinoline quinone biosynthesis protein D